MTSVRVALANIEIPKDPHDSVERALAAVADAARAGAQVVCFPEAYVPGYPWADRPRSPLATASFLREAHASVARAAAAHGICVVLGTERFVADRPRLSALVVLPDGQIAGYQDKVQLDLPEEPVYEPGCERLVFEISGLRFGVVICHECFRYPEAARWAARRGAQLLFVPYYDEAVPGGFQPREFADARNTFHEKTFLCRAAENSCFVAAVNCASPGASNTSAVARPDGTLLCYQPYGQAGLLVCDIDPTEATGLLAQRFRPNAYS